MSWAAFWIALFSYLTITRVVSMLTYNKRRALYEAVENEFTKQICEKVESFLDSNESLQDITKDIVDELDKSED